MSAQAAAPVLLSFEGISKRFGGTLAVDDVSIDLRQGQILALLGENGAGKSTLIKTLAGIHTPDQGRILFRGEPYRHLGKSRGSQQQVAFIHQDLGLIDWMTAAENVALGVGYKRRLGLIDWGASRTQALAALRTMSADIDPDARIMHLSRTERSLVAIGRALAARAQVLVLDEPTASLPADEVERLLAVLRELAATGIGMIYVSHRLDEVFQVADDVAVLRDGRLVGCRRIADTSPSDLVTMIVGRPPEQVFARPGTAGTETCLTLDGLVAGDAGPISLTLRRGEIVGLVGLRGAGQDHIGRALFGCRPIEAGTATLAGRPYHPDTPAAAMRAGVGLVAGDRVGESLGMKLSVRENLFLNPGASGHSLLGLLSPARERDETVHAGARMSLRPNDPQRPVENLSGGNQQKVVLARWLGLATNLLVLEEPTAGVDVGAKAEIYALLQTALEGGLAILVVATDFEEVANICHRALVFSQGRVCAEIARADLSVASILQAASAGGPAPFPALPRDPHAAPQELSQ
ncbi:sugar ABC transporter ATP-binding protein [Lichenicoccus roseus]|uniref:Sugar ABC transporter ATP-binding protein n=1 Tax=Lichenicoccus roseus TaxID=2683649 RepID=A0A5R9JAV7_9PROT|nr:sugar ABC transporter ATP-binding protein [Lichenicoccus roseus]TLU74129.1 sugar ABC transporter ATP-binding protein [Lichenicoccus roseus]